jgi:outer membrane protein assembly factor BamB
MARLLAVALLALPLAAQPEWPRFRGPNGTGVNAAASNLPAQFSPDKNLAWKTAVPFGRSSPIVAGGKIFLTASEGKNFLTLAFDLDTGRTLWRREVPRARTQVIYKANDAASPTPATDGQNLFVFFSDFGLVSYTLDGAERWRHPLGPFKNFYGVSTSPIVHNGVVFLLIDQLKDSYLLALDAGTGKQKWRTARPRLTEGWSIPIVHENQIIATGSTSVDAYFLSTGEPAWSYPLNSIGAMGSPVVHDNHLLAAASGMDQPWLPTWAATREKLDKNADGKVSLAECKDETDWNEHFPWVDANSDGFLVASEWNTARDFGIGNYGAVSIPLASKGQLEASAAKWRLKRNIPYVPAPVLSHGVYFMVKTGGIVTSVNPDTGEIFKQGRAPDALGEYLASPVAADGKIFLVNGECAVTVLNAQAEWEVLAFNKFDDECFATPAVTKDALILRTRSTLYSFKSQ